jgi:hydroxypyruvate isomerase
VPGSHELDNTQELSYRFVANAIADLGFGCCVTHEWRPAPVGDPIESLERSLAIMEV